MGSVTATTNGAATPQIARKWLVNAPTTTLVASGRYEPCSDAKGCHGRQVHGEGPAPGDQVEHRRTQDPRDGQAQGCGERGRAVRVGGRQRNQVVNYQRRALRATMRIAVVLISAGSSFSAAGFAGVAGAALGHRSAVLGAVPAGLFPRDLALDQATDQVLLGNDNSRTVEEFRMPTAP
jgi:hypothetical protein